MTTMTETARTQAQKMYEHEQLEMRVIHQEEQIKLLREVKAIQKVVIELQAEIAQKDRLITLSKGDHHSQEPKLNTTDERKLPAVMLEVRKILHEHKSMFECTERHQTNALVGTLTSILSTFNLPPDMYYKLLKSEFGQDIVLAIDIMLRNERTNKYDSLMKSIYVRKIALLPNKMNVIHLQDLMDHLITDQVAPFQLRNEKVSNANPEPTRKRQCPPTSKAGSLDDSDDECQ